ncbi:uncharacterized protein MELLADRAFT_92307 [Melampsora larici-populina 98AG31]|uniref:Uncharacterized protein n=1 Tax=Melampsora larici-populina (strain 98AG31 / pathotype 3-4-7) TaxID=747676 RepID=F4R952_MELLP|nr:uncharacterized protein MELLADRAFT_92307 [Melampsora larici-populina 98AG31]EGG11215.1 hypothetical protein MELLADRAFT_92307 [Melampsora larici-populina 98AG31]
MYMQRAAWSTVQQRCTPDLVYTAHFPSDVYAVSKTQKDSTFLAETVANGHCAHPPHPFSIVPPAREIRIGTLVDGENFTTIINKKHENVKYCLVTRDAKMPVFCPPRQFIPNICHQLREAKVTGMPCSALSGANIANEGINIYLMRSLQKLIHTPQFHVQIIEDRAGVSPSHNTQEVIEKTGSLDEDEAM